MAKQHWLCVLLLATVVTLYWAITQEFSLLPRVSPQRKNQSQVLTPNTTKQATMEGQLTSAGEKANILTILIWYPPFGNYLKRVCGNPDVCGHCVVTYDKSKVDDPNTKAVIFHYKELTLETMPEHRRLDQYYIWWAMESPLVVMQHGHLRQFDGLFNLTMSYRRDADIYSPYGNFLGSWRNAASVKQLSRSQINEVLFGMKSKLAVWFVSNCGGTSGTNARMRLARKLDELGLKLDRFGKCFASKNVDKSGLRGVVQEYKFYMAFENIHYCRDYITEKFFQTSLIYGSVPVVWGAKKEDYDAVAPPNSYIYAEYFTEQGLVEYLQYLDKNDTAYMEYFKWRTIPLHELPAMDQQIKFCQICRILHGINVDNLYNSKYEEKYKWIPLSDFPNKPRIVPSIQNWLHDGEYDECLST